MFGRTYSAPWVYASWLPLFTGFNLLYGGMLWLGALGMPRRYYTHLPQYHTAHVVATVGSWLLALGLLMLFGTLLYALFRGRRATSNPWGGVTLEWRVPSPPPTENFRVIPTVTTGPYVFTEEREAGA
jgi:cytochrome c oxidase subunit 1